MRFLSHNPGVRIAFAGLALLLARPVLAQLTPLPKPLPDGAARLAAMEGSVSVQKVGGLWALNVGDTIYVQQLVVTGADGYARFEVADGSTFEVFPSSKVTFRNNPGDWRDLVDVWLGRIRVHIQKLGGLPNPNRVQTPTAIISVRGTVFDVAVTDDDETTTVAVAEGQVAVTHRLMHREGGTRLLNAGEEITVYRNVPLAAGRKLDRTRAAQYAAEALWQIMLRGPRIGGGSGGSTPAPTTPPPSQPLPGDTESTPPPPPPPPPPPGGGE